MKKVILILSCLFFAAANAQQIALNFAGDNDWVTGTNTSLPQGNNPRTIETWIRYSTSRNDMSIFNYGTFSYNQKFTLHLYNGVYIIGEGNDLATGYNFNDGNWHHLAVTHDGATTIVYVDGIIRGSKNTTYNTTGFDYQMGVSLRNGSWDFRFEGTIDELRVWNVARTQQQIIDNMHVNFNSVTGLVALYHLNDGIPNGDNTAITNVLDATGNGNHGTLNNFALTGTSSNFVNDAILLPLRLSGFSTRQVNCTAYISWKTADESNMLSFVIEESENGLCFTPVKVLFPKNTPGENCYAAELPVHSGKTFYRIKLYDGNNQITYSNTVTVNAAGCTYGVDIRPNPASRVLTIISSAVGREYRIYSSAGILIQSAMLRKESQEIDISKCTPGLYFLTVAGARPVAFVKE
jgi:hypothetical protein